MLRTLFTLSRPGRTAAKVSSFARRAPAVWLPNCCAAAPSTHPVSNSALTLAEYRIQPRLEVFFALAPQFVPLHRQRPLNRLDPAEQLLDVLAGLCGIFAAVRF